MMFEVSSLSQCPETGIASFELKWDTGRGIKTDQGSFMQLDDACRYIESSKRSFILILFDTFIYKARINFEIGDSEYYQNEKKLSALDRCIKYTHWLEGKDLATICRVLLALDEDFRKILPKPSDKSFGEMESAILDMIIFCKREKANLPVCPTP